MFSQQMKFRVPRLRLRVGRRGEREVFEGNGTDGTYGAGKTSSFQLSTFRGGKEATALRQ